MIARLTTEPWWTGFRASQVLLAAILLAPAFLANPFDAEFFRGFGVPLALTILGGVRLWSERRTGLLLLIGNAGALVLALLLLTVERPGPWATLQVAVPGEAVTLVIACGLAVIGIAGALAMAPLVPATRPSVLESAVVLAAHGALAALLLGQMTTTLSEDHGYVGLAIPLFGGPALFLLLGYVAWWLGSWVMLVIADALMALWAMVQLGFAIGMGRWESGMEAPLAWLLLAGVGGLLATRLRPLGGAQPVNH